MFHFDSSKVATTPRFCGVAAEFVMREDYDPCTRTAQPDQARTNRGVSEVEEQAAMSCLKNRKNRASRARKQ